MTTSSLKPRAVTPGKVEEEDVGRPLLQFKFVNRTRYTILIAWGWDPFITAIDPDYTIEPYTSQIVMPEQPQEKFIWVADPAWGVESARQSGNETFGYTATDKILAIAAVSSSATDVISTPPTVIEGGIQADVSKLINEDTAADIAFILGQLSGDNGRRITVRTNGVVNLGLGVGAPEPIWEIPAAGQVKFLEELLLTGNPTTDNGATRRAYVQNQDAATLASAIAALDGRITLLADNNRGATAGPSTYPRGLSSWRRTDGLGGWPGSGSGTIFTVSETGVAYTIQFFADAGSAALYWRLGFAGDTWTAFSHFASRTYVDNAEADANAYADAAAAGALASARDVVSSVLSMSADWTLGTPLRARRIGFSVSLEGQVINNTAGTFAAGKQITTITPLFAPDQVLVFPCSRFVSGGWDNTAVNHVRVTPAGDVEIAGSCGAGVTVDLASLGWIRPDV